MGFAKKAQVDSGFEPDGSAKKRLVSSMSIRPALKPVNTRPKGKENTRYEEDEQDEEAGQRRSTTPTAKEFRILEKLPCPSAPRKQRPSRCNNVVAREFFASPDLEAFFKCYTRKAV